jgi:[ribosomal protein S18]-alanine N-acetyltransferase
MKIRRMVPADVPEIGAILAASPQAAQWNLREFVQPEWPAMAIWVAAADDSGEVTGMVAARTIVGEAEVLNLAVAPAWRRSGIGRRLVDVAIEAARAEGVRQVFLEVRESNAAARAFYAGLLFAESGRRRAYYRDPIEDALVLSRTLS